MAHKEADLILYSVEFHVPDLSALHIPGKENLKVEIQNQSLDSREGTFHSKVFQNLCHKWGMPDMKLLASRVINGLRGFVSRSRDNLAFEMDALVMWDHFNLIYAFPPLKPLPYQPHGSWTSSGLWQTLHGL